MPGLFSVDSLTEIGIVSITNRELCHYQVLRNKRQIKPVLRLV